MNDPRIRDLLTRAVSEIIDQGHLAKQLASGKKLRVKLGIDPTSPNLHIGRAVVLWKLRQFQELGHHVIFIVGDGTGVIGDTSDKETERPIMTREQLTQNMKTYAEQAFKILDKNKTEVRFNSEWLSKLGFFEIGEMADLFSWHEFSAREVIARRVRAGKRISLREVLYPIMQGYDSVAVKADVELGGTDQRFNLLAGRTIQPLYKQSPQDIVMTNLLEGTDGRKMSSSWGNVINITDEPNDMFGKVMSIDDDLIVKYFEYATRLPMAEIKTIEQELKSGANPRDIKKRLAGEIVTLYHGSKAATSASKEWAKVFSQKEKPSEIREVKVKSKAIVDVLVETKLASSKSEARRLLAQKGVKVDDEIASESVTVKPGIIIQVGKRKFIKLL
ncbi:MAG: tyrosine--tRNA ligase [Candidatus Doudnabacteria bacterium RIFCSPHIGHO2_12_FULL_48_11]|uniref:Tyrosine--tRNA ligase n=1 Tax=Candidatus Doudnabacteria bacterium RIFCSPHIGHO2_01_FULL_46_24 TaxID=1817825 RepID=A0A1F5NT18_9BACT|nr:MAG: tyrosine--tRNA ligase [Candidatus Doudnabacteria bacterium RIFCSPHIGHO2_01_FULL_46_24]OGE95846.1 MAG: tyrosine--tRNA ligase [Candidatus Doudnabacteria bacterium RIFCSPHIGHO2_12_FULL_48_11]